MFAPTTAEDAASQSNTNRTVDVVVDILKPNAPKIIWEEGDNWVRFINTRGNAWFRDVTYYEMRSRKQDRPRRPPRSALRRCQPPAGRPDRPLPEHPGNPAADAHPGESERLFLP